MRALAPAAVHPSGTSWFSIVGAPRCGTTSLARYLGSHPDVCFSCPKEPHFFSRQDLRQLPPSEVRERVRDQYLNRFFAGRPDGAVLADGSVSYLYTPERVLPVLKLWPDARFIVAVRNPLEMLPSLHRRHLYNGDENVRDFARAWSMVDERRRGRHIPSTCLEPRLLDYEEIGLLGKHVRRFLEIVGRNRCFVSVFDDLIANPAEQHRRIIEFLDLPLCFPSQFVAHRQSMNVRIGWLQRMLKRPPKRVRTMFVSDADLIREGKLNLSTSQMGFAERRVAAIRKRLLQWNRTSATPAKLSPQLHAELSARFRDDVLELSALLGRDLRHWLEHPAG